MDKETKIFLAIAYGFGIYLILKNKKFLQNKVFITKPSKTTPNMVSKPPLPSVNQTQVVTDIPQIIRPEYNYARNIYKMSDSEWAECQKDPAKCKY